MFLQLTSFSPLWNGVQARFGRMRVPEDDNVAKQTPIPTVSEATTSPINHRGDDCPGDMNGDEEAR